MPKKKKKRKKSLIRKQWPLVRKLMLRGNERFLVDPRPFRDRKLFKTEADALVQADVWSLERENQGTEALSFPTELRVETTEALSDLKPYGKSIRDAVKHYVNWLEEQKRHESALSVGACLDEWLAAKTAEFTAGHLAPTTLQELKSKAKIIRAAYGSQRVSEIDEHSVQSFLDALPHAPRGKLNIRMKLTQFLNYCRRRKWITQNPAETIRVRVHTKDIEILRPTGTKALLNAANASTCRTSVMPYLLVSIFGGLRPGEGEQLRWEFIDFDTGEIEVLAKTSKTRETRFVKMEDTLVAWLFEFRKRRGPIIGSDFEKDWKEVRKAAGYKVSGSKEGKPWPKDVLRHTFGTYWLAEHEDRARLAERMGNTVQVIRAYYKRAIPKAEAKQFWALRPEGDGKIIPINTTARSG